MLYFDNNYKQIASLLFHRNVGNENFAIQCNISGEGSGKFYIENKNNKLSIEPYEYIDNNIIIEASFNTYMLLCTKQVSVDTALNLGMLNIIRGDKNVLYKVF